MDVSLPEARKIGYSHVTTTYTMNLDDDTIIDLNYVDQAIILLKNNDNVIVVALDLLGRVRLLRLLFRSVLLVGGLRSLGLSLHRKFYCSSRCIISFW